MLLTVALLVVAFANPADRPKGTPANAEAAAEVLASWNNRLRTLWEKNKGVGLPAGLPWTERVTLRPWSEKGKRFDNPVERVDAFRVKHDGATAFVLSGKQVTGGRPAPGSEITDANGAVWVVGIAVGPSPDYACYVRKK